MAKEKNAQVELQIEIKKLAAEAGDQLANKDHDGAWKTMGKLSNLFKEGEHGLSVSATNLLSQYIKNYYYQNKKLNSATYGLSKIAEGLSEVSSLIKPEQ